MEILGIDVGGTGLKGAIVDIEKGELISERYKVATPQPATPESISGAIKTLIEHFQWRSMVGCSFPAVINKGKAMTHANLDKSWVGVQVDTLFSEASGGLPFYVANDADLAGIAEMALGAGQDRMGKVMMITIGTGIGSGLFYNGQLVPNIELGRAFHTDGKVIEAYAANSARKRDELSLEEWAKRFDFFLHHLNTISSPDCVIIGGGISKKFEKFEKYLTAPLNLVPAQFRNNAGIIGAAMYAKSLALQPQV